MATETTAQPVSESDGGRGRTRGAKGFFKQLGKEVLADNIDNVGAMMAYYAILALFPMVLFVLTLALLVIPEDTVRQGLAMVSEAMPPAASQVITERVQSLLEAAAPGFAVGSAVFALWGASRGAVALSGALNTMYDKQETRPWWKRQVIAIAVTLAVAVIVVVALALLVVGPVAGHWFADRFGLGEVFDTLWSIGRWVGAGLLVMVVWAVVYKYLPDTDAPLRIFTPGAVIGVLLWLGISWLFGLYLQNFGSYEATYGAIAGLIIFLTWLWLSNMAILFGAEVNDVLADVRQHRSEAAAKLAGGANHRPRVGGEQPASS